MDCQVDLQALLAALVLAPRTFARNRFFWLFTQPDARRIRSRAAQLRTIVRHLAGGEGQRGTLTGQDMGEDGRVVLRYRVREIGLLRTAILDPLEISVVRFALHQAGAETALRLSDEDRARVEHALLRLGDHLKASENEDDAGSTAPEETAPGGSDVPFLQNGDP